AVRRGKERKSLAAVGRAEHTGIQHVDGVDTTRISEDVREVPGTLSEALIVVNLRPGITAIVRAIEAVVLRLDQRINAIRVGTRNRNSDATHNSGGQSLPFQALPGVATVY